MLKYINEGILLGKKINKNSNLLLNEESDGDEGNFPLKKYKQNNYKDEEKLGIFNYKYKFSETLESNKETFWQINEKKRKMVIDSSLKETKSKVIIKNFLNKLLNIPNLKKYIFEEKCEISWSSISDKLKTYSNDDLKNQWNKLLNDLNLNKQFLLRQDYKMISYIMRNEFESIEDVNFKKIRNKL